jgi:TetR/AcrR family transcriptional regulator, transcriptional repressor for nem operon
MALPSQIESSIYQKIDKKRCSMADMRVAIMDAAERRIRVGGFNGFSFREIGADVGVKSSSVHYYFPTKDDLAAAVVRQYTEETSLLIDRGLESDADAFRVWANAFRGTLHSKCMCPCTVLGAAALDLPPQVAAEVKNFFKMCLDKLVAGGKSAGEATKFLSTITGALVIANALRDNAEYDRAVSEFLIAPQTS